MITETVFAGSGGQGVLMMGYILSTSAMMEDKNVTYLPSYGAAVRGGTADCTVCISADEEIACPVASSPDYAVVMNKPSMLKCQHIIKSGGVMIINSSLVDADPARADIEVVKIPANQIALELGNDRALNMIMLGAFAAKTRIATQQSLMQGLAVVLKGKKGNVLELNRKAMLRGAECA